MQISHLGFATGRIGAMLMVSKGTPMNFTTQDLWQVVFGAIVPQMREGKPVGALAPNVAGKPYVEWAYNGQNDTLLVLCFLSKPGNDTKPWKEYAFPQFGEACSWGMEGAINCRTAGCGDPNCTECGSGSVPKSNPYRTPFGADLSRPKSEEDFIGFRQPKRK